MPPRIAATAADTPQVYQRLNNYAQSGRERPARHAPRGTPTAGDLGPDYVRQRIAVLDSALGIFSPGIPGLHELVRKAEHAVSAPSTVERQHVISEVVLRRFAGPVPSGGRLLAYFDLAAGQCTLARSKDAGYIEHFYGLDHPPTSAELKRIAEPWRPFRTWASVLLRVAGDRLGLPVSNSGSRTDARARRH